MTRLYHRVYLAAYGGWIMPRWQRRIIANTHFHRAWVLGFHGYFTEAGIAYGPANPYHPAI